MSRTSQKNKKLQLPKVRRVFPGLTVSGDVKPLPTRKVKKYNSHYYVTFDQHDSITTTSEIVITTTDNTNGSLSSSGVQISSSTTKPSPLKPSEYIPKFPINPLRKGNIYLRVIEDSFSRYSQQVFGNFTIGGSSVSSPSEVCSVPDWSGGQKLLVLSEPFLPPEPPSDWLENWDYANYSFETLKWSPPSFIKCYQQKIFNLSTQTEETIFYADKENLDSEYKYGVLTMTTAGFFKPYFYLVREDGTVDPEGIFHELW